ncbi:MAG: hypothetical protein AB1704_28420 [Pseudomonadota bacterium]|jgi:hypothetical protein|uniref:hypothetical protein n=1 Tax=Burkholderiaceae TaxID=119060 RepID=UPI0010F99C6C|nr:hypothetical protein [Burkholderia sp. 4M9327F10]
MTSTRELIDTRLSVLVGLDVSSLNHAADMLTLQFGPLRETVTRKDTMKRVGEWALHVQCRWQIKQLGAVVATQDDLYGPDEKARLATQRLEDLLVSSRLTTVESLAGSESGALCISLSAGLQLVITPEGMPNNEDWRFFAPGADANHFVIEGGAVDPYSLI